MLRSKQWRVIWRRSVRNGWMMILCLCTAREKGRQGRKERSAPDVALLFSLQSGRSTVLCWSTRIIKVSEHHDLQWIKNKHGYCKERTDNFQWAKITTGHSKERIRQMKRKRLGAFNCINLQKRTPDDKNIVELMMASFALPWQSAMYDQDMDAWIY